MKYDVVIIGGGPIGLNCAIEAKKAGLSYVILEKGVLVNSLYNFPTNMTFFSTSNLLEIGGVPFIAHNDKPTRREALEYFRRVQDSWDLEVHLYTEVKSMDHNGEVYQVETTKGMYKANNVIVATGFYDTPRMLNIPGEDLKKVKHFYDDPHPYVDQKVLVIGAANSACDVALETYYKGADVTMAIRESEIYPKVKYWIRPNIENRIKEGSIKAYFNTSVTEIRPNEVVLQTADGQVVLENDFVLAMTGYMPNYQLFESLGIPVSTDEYRIPLHNEKTLETELSGVYVAGVINAGMQTSKLFIENTRVHSRLIVQSILSKKNSVVGVNLG
ncbi:MAG: YpdA family putative bacillithiol disulfide reductase [Roseivirga sp.]|uniref:YpdA family putative bacillithiol disulfide reductase n=1 Tax=Roseivirga sp. TaxID=1964215 RepID=UPI001B13FEC8|nr:YpdA family putative bacillithiol disulfide reductase [Roseivirga sp.]MBO6661439.1 YpdA family putative bacillithiol disulfide reductase [Roseivirga sp.]MBO6760096.1 YpdA family putative bacillithiol disulfide reductase [Roseivirga sp.]MBO6908577.1 YpdA family putative bacillithiol disulfide reductase [Roseivirga sp.]